MFPAQNGCCIPLQRCVNYQCWVIPAYILDILVRENTLWAGVIPSPLTEEHLTLQMRNPSDVTKIFFFPKILPCQEWYQTSLLPIRNVLCWAISSAQGTSYTCFDFSRALYIKTGVNIHIMFFSLSHSCLNVGRIKGVGCWMHQSVIREEYQNVFSSLLTGLQISMPF